MHPDGFLCLVCEETRTKSEGQLCPACVEAGCRRENDQVIVPISINF
jgi:hypothetical protein